ncbi:MAG: twitch domain-containing radical SAM protein, partial [Rhizobacter sp.]|nr:twitch domain-containing radical SAM protein [Bacteriovorax sp.]
MDAISPSFCLAKWAQSTIYLNSGHTHSCHHTPVHKIPLENLNENPGQIHNTPFKIEKRKEMLDGVRPKECDYCWQIEDLGENFISDRVMKSSLSWSMPFYKNIVESKTGVSYNPSYLEVFFDMACNFKCIYCSPDVSSKIRSEIETHGPYQLGTDTILNMDPERQGNENTDYIEAFWKVLPEWWNGLHTLRITGGEPLLSPETWRVFDYVKEHGNPKLNLAVNTNLGVPENKINLLVKYINEMSNGLNMFEVYTSNEASGKEAEFIRYGLDYKLFLSNIKKILDETNSQITLMTTVNLLSYSSFSKCILEFIELRKKYPKRIRNISFNYLRYPICLDLKYLPDSLKQQFTHEMKKILESNELDIFEKESAQRLIEYVKKEPKDKAVIQKDLLLYLAEIDRRRGTFSQDVFSDLYKEINREL